MRKLALTVLAGALLAACNPAAQAPGGGGDSGGGGAGGGFPNLFQTAYRAEATMMNPESGQAMPIVLIRDGQKVRMEMTSAQGAFVMINNPDTGETYTIMSRNGSQMATRSATADVSDPWTEWSAEVNATATPTGPCTGAGQTGAGWSSVKEGVTSTVCVTGDGIILHATENGQTTWETTNVQRGPQDAALFALPPGIQVMDFGNMSGAIEKMRDAQRP